MKLAPEYNAAPTIFHVLAAVDYVTGFIGDEAFDLLGRWNLLLDPEITYL